MIGTIKPEREGYYDVDKRKNSLALLAGLVISGFLIWASAKWLDSSQSLYPIWILLALVWIVRSSLSLLNPEREYDPDFGPSLRRIKIESIAMLIIGTAFGTYSVLRLIGSGSLAQ